MCWGCSTWLWHDMTGTTQEQDRSQRRMHSATSSRAGHCPADTRLCIASQLGHAVCSSCCSSPTWAHAAALGTGHCGAPRYAACPSPPPPLPAPPPSGGAVLDLMSSWVSHLPGEVRYSKVVGHGMNAAELARNPRLDTFFVRNLNEEPDGWSAQEQSFDAVVCCVRWGLGSAGWPCWCLL
jgi:hypothetical protein